ncbi:MFS transporter [Caulifigura coniformis]|uniref:MFS transporter n=1 Tax=Caulifigura coniformis TaxID=2527983 RepID=UPI0011A4F2E3|nr:MFS transporter [Caulifigura coniformis]
MSSKEHHSPEFLRARRRSLGAVMFCYLFYYTGRQTFGFAIPGIQAELGIDKQTLGWISAAMLWSYAAGQMINGNLGDRFGGRRMMCLGAVASFILNWLTSFGSGTRSLATAWGLNGLAQSMGWAPGSRLVSNWFTAGERGRAFGMYVFAAGLSSVLSYVTSLVVLDVLHLDWRWIFRLPVLLMLLGGFVVWLVARDRPSDLGFADLQDDAGGTEEGPIEHETAWQRYALALSNGRLLLAGLAIGFQNTVRYGLLIWVPVYFLGKDFKDDPVGKWISIALPIGMALGAVTSGWISDRLCGSRRSGVISSFMLLAAASAMLMYWLPAGSRFGVPVLFLAGFFAYGPQSAFWALAPDLLGRARAGTAVGVMNFFAYAMAGLGEPLIGWMVQHNPFATTPGVENVALVFPIVAAAAGCSAALALLIRR